jgi:hypothetical protein
VDENAQTAGEAEAEVGAPAFEFDSGILDDHRVQQLDARHFKVWINLLCLAAQTGSNEFTTPLEEVAWALHEKPEEFKQALYALKKVWLVELLGLSNGDLDSTFSRIEDMQLSKGDFHWVKGFRVWGRVSKPVQAMSDAELRAITGDGAE